MVTRKRGRADRWRLWTAVARKRGRGLRAVVVGLSTLLGLIASVLALLDDPRIRPPQPPPVRPMLGDLRLGVAPFDSTDSRQGGATPASTTTAMRVATGVADLLATELAPLRRRLRVELRPPAELSPIGQTTPAGRAQAAAALADQHGADILVHGRLVVEATSTRLEPQVYLAGSSHTDVGELLGDYRLGAAVVTPGDPDSNPLLSRELAERLAARVRALAALSVAISYYHLDRLEEADRYLTMAGQSPAWRDSGGAELLRLVAGNVAARRAVELRRDGRDAAAAAQFTRAMRAYRAALAAQPGYARALYGIAETRFLQLNLRCPQSTPDDVQRLRQVVAAFSATSRAPYQPVGANLDLKIDFGLGRAYVCLSLAGVDHRADAAAHLNRVLAAADPPTRPQTVAVTRLAAETHAQLGLLAFAEPPGPARRASLQAAVSHYQRAISLSQADPDRSRVFWVNLAQVYDELDDPTAAAQARARAQTLAEAHG